MTARLAAGFWVAAYRARLDRAGIPAYVAAKGDETAGAVVVKLSTLDGQARLYGREGWAGEARPWAVLAEGPEAEIDAAIGRRRRTDPDLWVIEVEDRAGRTLLDEPGLAEG